MGCVVRREGRRSRSSRTAWLTAGLLAIGLALGRAPVALAQVPGEEIARHAFEDGVALEKKGDYPAALAKFRESMEIKATLGNRFHIAYCLEMTGKLAAALGEYEIVDKTAREQNKADVVEATRVRLEPLRTKVPQLALKMTSPPKDAEVELDGKAVPAVLLDGKSFRIDPGEHTVTAHAAQHNPFTKTITSAETFTITVDIVLEPSAPAAAATHTDPRAITGPPKEEPKKPPRTGAIITTVSAVALGGAGLAAFLVAGSTSSDAEKVCPTRVSCASEQDKVRTFDALALGGFIGAAGLGVLAVVLWTSKPVASASSASNRTSLVARPSWLGLEGRF
jgi:hypothetical protein